MTDERRAAINRRLAEFEDQRDMLEGKATWAVTIEASDYTRDLNALARLERKLPVHHWYLLVLGDEKRASAELWFFEYIAKPVVEDTEAEARAEAICKYLEARP